jgi:hypothetical protein
VEAARISASVACGAAVRRARDGLKANRSANARGGREDAGIGAPSRGSRKSSITCVGLLRWSEAPVSGVLSGLACYPSDVPVRGGLIEVEVRSRLGVGKVECRRLVEGESVFTWSTLLAFHHAKTPVCRCGSDQSQGKCLAAGVKTAQIREGPNATCVRGGERRAGTLLLLRNTPSSPSSSRNC